MEKVSFALSCVMSVVMLSGCASHMALTKENSAAIKTVQIDPNVKKPTEMNYLSSSGARSATIGGVVGLALTQGSMNAESAELQNLAKKNQIDITKIVKDTWMSELNAKSRYKVGESHGDVVLVSEIENYGLLVPHALTNALSPQIRIKSTLKKNGKVVWTDTATIMPLNGKTPRHSFEEIERNPEYLNEMWRKATQLAVDEMIADLNHVV